MSTATDIDIEKASQEEIGEWVREAQALIQSQQRTIVDRTRQLHNAIKMGQLLERDIRTLEAQISQLAEGMNQAASLARQHRKHRNTLHEATRLALNERAKDVLEPMKWPDPADYPIPENESFADARRH